MSKLIIIDVQETYRSFFTKNLCENIIEFSKNFNQVYFIYDTIDGQSFNEDLPFEFMENEEFSGTLNEITKEYGFIRSLMDLGLDSDDEELVKLLRFMIKNNVCDARDIEQDEDLHNKFLKEFGNGPLMEVSFDDYPISIPMDLVDSLIDLNNPVLVGGARNECLKEISILLRSLDIVHTIEESLTY